MSREQLKVLFNYLIDNIEIKELDIFDNKKIVLAITIHLKLDGYAPKQTLEYLKNIRISDNEKKTSKSQNETCLSNGGGEGPTIPKSKFYFTIPVTIEMVLYRSMQIEDLLFEN